jgi:hypothetical protein
MISFIAAPDILQCSSTMPGSGTFSGVLGPQEGRLHAASHNSFQGVNDNVASGITEGSFAKTRFWDPKSIVQAREGLARIAHIHHGPGSRNRSGSGKADNLKDIAAAAACSERNDTNGTAGPSGSL